MSATLVSFRRPDRDGWRWALGWRTRRDSSTGYWELQRWSDDPHGWVHVAYVGSYAAARALAGGGSR